VFTFLLFPELLQEFSDQKWFVFNVFPVWAMEDFFFKLGWTSWSLEAPGALIVLLYKLFITVAAHWAVLQFSFGGFASDTKFTSIKIFYSVGLLLIGLAFVEYLLWFFLIFVITLDLMFSFLGYVLGFLGFMFIVIPIIGVCFSLPPIGLFLLYKNLRLKIPKN